MTHEVAVYGTLKQGEDNYPRLLPGKEPIFRGVVELPYRMYDNGEYPMLVPHPELSPVGIEVFAVDDVQLRALDDLELPYGYRRETVPVEPLGRSVAIYVYPGPPPSGFSLVPTGVWSSSVPFGSGSGSESGDDDG